MNKSLFVVTLTLAVSLLYFILRFQDLVEVSSFFGIAYFCIEIFIGICSLFYWRTLLMGKSATPPLTDLTSIGDVNVDVLIPTADESYGISNLLVKSSKGQRLSLESMLRKINYLLPDKEIHEQNQLIKKVIENW